MYILFTSNLNKLSQLSNSLKYNNPEQLIKYKEQYFNETKLKLTHVAQNIIIKKEMKYKKRSMICMKAAMS